MRIYALKKLGLTFSQIHHVLDRCIPHRVLCVPGSALPISRHGRQWSIYFASALAEKVHSADIVNRENLENGRKMTRLTVRVSAGGPAYPNRERLPVSLWNGIRELF